MSAATHNIVIDQGSDFALDMVVKQDNVPVDLTGYFARAHLRPKKGSNTQTATFTCSLPTPASGTVRMEMANATSSAITPAVYYYDLEIYTAGDAVVNRLLEGEAKLSAETTK